MSAPPGSRLGQRRLAQLRDHYRTYLFEEYLPFWDRHGIDHERGGFLCGLDHDGTCIDDTKNMWYQGRGLWAYSYLYRHFGGEAHREVARRTRDFLLRCGRDERGRWVTTLSREGAVLAPASPRGYEGLFVAEGLQAYAHATGDAEALEVAIATLAQCTALYADPARPVDEGYVPRCYPGMRILGVSMVTLLTLTQLLEQGVDGGLAAQCDQVVEAIVRRFWNPAYELMNEALDHGFSRPADENEDFVYLGHAIETLWMLMAEALRRGDRALLELAAQRFRRHLEVAWDDVCGGFFRAVKVGEMRFELDKVLWLQEEVLIGTMILLEHTDWEWPAAWFERTFQYVEEKFRLAPYGYPLYQTGGDRRVTFQPHVRRKEHYHHPRQVMRNLLAVERLLVRPGDGAAAVPPAGR
ncbi:MAG: AGE family epimerase/isomerase [Gemmatimonadota bacterium]